MERSIKNGQRKVRMLNFKVDGTGTASLGGLDINSATLVDNGTGDYTITFDQAFAATDYVVSLTPVTAGVIPRIKTRAAGALTVECLSDGTATNSVAASATTTGLTTAATITATAAGDEANDRTVTIVVNAAAANPTDTILLAVTGTERAITLTVTPNDGTNNGATPVNLTTAELVEFLATGAVVGKTVTLTNTLNLISLITATGGGAENLANGGEGDGESVTLASGTDTVALAGAAIDADFDVMIIGSDITDRY